MVNLRHRRAAGIALAWISSCLALGASPVRAQVDAAPGAESELPAAAVSKPPFVLELRSLAEHTDNVFRTVDGRVADTLTALGFIADIRHDGRMLDYAVRADIDWEHYLDDSFKDAAAGSVSLSADWGNRSDIFQWTVRDTFTQSRLDPVANTTPDNLENVNFFSTGPTVSLPLGGVHQFRMQGLYSNARYEESPFGSDRLSASVGLERTLAAKSRVGLYALGSRTEFQEAAPASDFDLQEYFVRYEAEGLRTRLSADAGYARVDEEQESSGSPLLRLALQRKTSGSTLYARAEQRFASAAELTQSLAGSPAGGETGGAGFSAPLSVAGALESRAVAVGWSRDRPRTALSLELGWRAEGYRRDPALDRSLLSVQAGVTRRLRSTLSLRVSAQFETEDLEQPGASADYTTVTAELEQRVGRRLRLFLGYDHRQRSGSANANRYSESSIGLRVVYSLAERGVRSDRWSLAQ
jgi:hypothetical protein